MQNAVTQLSSWRDAAFISPDAAAQVLGYSTAQVRMLISIDALAVVRQAKNGPIFVTVESLTKLIGEAVPVSEAEMCRLRRSWKTTGANRPALSLVVNNL